MNGLSRCVVCVLCGTERWGISQLHKKKKDKKKTCLCPESWILQETEEEQGVCLMIQNPSRMKTRIFFWALHQRLHICVFSSGFKDF